MTVCCSTMHAVRACEMLVQVTSAEQWQHRRQRLRRLLQVSQILYANLESPLNTAVFRTCKRFK